MKSTAWMTIEETMKYLGIGRSKLYELARKKQIPRHKVGKIWRFHRDDVDAWVRASRPVEKFFTSVDYDVEGNDELRDPQREAFSAVHAHFAATNERAIVQLPVGCGKSGVIAVLPLGLAEGRVLVIAPNLTIRDSLHAELNVTNRRMCFCRKRSVLTPETMLGGPHVAVLDGKDANIHDCERSHIVLTNIQQLASSADRWLPEFSDGFFDLILVDEGHHSAATSWTKVFERFPEAKVVNLTATPYRADDKEIVGKLVYRYSFKRAMIKGYIKHLQAIYVAPSEITFTYEGDTRTHTLGEVLELKEENWFSRGVALSATCNENIVTASLDRLEWLRRAGTQHQLVAVAMQIEHAREIRSLYAERGYEAETIHSKMTTEERAEVLRKLRSGLIDVIVQVQILGEGFDHPRLSVAAIFRPFRSLAPYLQFIGRTMRVVVQNDPRHPDNYGFIVTHAGMNLDELLAEFRDVEREDHEYLQGLIGGKEPEAPREVTEGLARMKIQEDMVVQDEVLDSLIEEDFIDVNDDIIFDELRRQAESMSLDADLIVAAAKKTRKPSRRTVAAPEKFEVNPQLERREARRRLNERVKHTASVLLNRLDVKLHGRELECWLARSVYGPNLIVALQLLNQRIKKLVSSESRQHWTTEELKKAMELLPEILDANVQKLKARQKDFELGAQDEKEAQ